MPLRNSNESTDETILEFQAAAEDRYWESISLMTNGQFAGGVYLIGYTAEMILKNAYFVLIGEKLTTQIWPLLAPAWAVGAAYFPGSFSFGSRDYHNLDFWTRLLREERRRRGISLTWYLDAEFLFHTRRLYMTWWVEMRYRHSQSTAGDAEDALESVSWLRKHYIILATP